MHLCFFLLFTLILAPMFSNLLGQESLPGDSTSPGAITLASHTVPTNGISEVDVTEQREAVDEEIRVARRQAEAAKTESSEGAVPEHVQQEIDLLGRIDVILAQQETALAERKQLETKQADAQAMLAEVQRVGVPGDQPYSFLLLDRLLDDLSLSEKKLLATQSSARSVNESKLTSDSLAKEAEAAFRRSKEEAAAQPQLERTRAVKIAELNARIATEHHRLVSKELENQKAAEAIAEIEVAAARLRVEIVSANRNFSEQDLAQRTGELDERTQKLTQQIQRAQQELRRAESKWFQSRLQKDSTETNVATGVEATKLFKELRQQELVTLNSRLRRQPVKRDLWTRRFQVANRLASASHEHEWSIHTEQLLQQLDQEEQSQRYEIDQVQRNIHALEQRAEQTDKSAEEAELIAYQNRVLRRIADTHVSNVSSIASLRGLAEKLLGELEAHARKTPVRSAFTQAYLKLTDVWNHELTTVEDRPITVGKLALGASLLLGGFWLARILSRLLGWVLTRRFSLDASAAAPLQSLFFYGLLVAFALSALNFVSVPLTFFKFLGGAIAIGVGFGSQNIINNFISGLIMLAERPIKVGDLICLDNLFGNVIRIGARSTMVRTANNQDIVVPNSKFLENNVVNLTLEDSKTRTSVSVGIAYGSPTRDAMHLMKQAACEHGRILSTPEPFVWFSEFGDNALNFELHFWISIKTIGERRQIESDVRMRIDKLFREAGITIAFPQRDIHLDTARPFEVRVLPPTTESSGEIRPAA